ncbi:MAG: hypothetical protein B0A82_07945 [Alkalinema sp. CACIAM 70d]|nr:MAG: hypothetical protein B0A82_07945 [Alkalinema sp. CACIAM 70d]
MKFQRSPLILLLVAALLGIGVYVVEGRKSTPQATQTAGNQPIFNFQEADIRAFTLKTLVNTLVFEKQGNQWQMLAPEKTPASEAAIAFLTNLLATSQSERSLPTAADRRAEFGLEPPLATVEVKLADQKVHTLVLGKSNFNRTALYAIVDPPTDPKAELTVLLVPTTFESAVTRPLAEWKASAPKASPSPSVSPSPSPSPSASPSPVSSTPASPAPAASTSPAPTPAPPPPSPQ